MKRGSLLWVQEPNGSWERATYEFRVEEGEPLGHHSVMLDNGGGRRVVCGCKTSLVERGSGPTSIYAMRGKMQVTPEWSAGSTPPAGITRIAAQVQGEGLSIDVMDGTRLIEVVFFAIDKTQHSESVAWEVRDASGALALNMNARIGFAWTDPIFIAPTIRAPL